MAAANAGYALHDRACSNNSLCERLCVGRFVHHLGQLHHAEGHFKRCTCMKNPHAISQGPGLVLIWVLKSMAMLRSFELNRSFPDPACIFPWRSSAVQRTITTTFSSKRAVEFRIQIVEKGVGHRSVIALIAHLSGIMPDGRAAPQHHCCDGTWQRSKRCNAGKIVARRVPDLAADAMRHPGGLENALCRVLRSSPMPNGQRRSNRHADVSKTAGSRDAGVRPVQSCIDHSKFASLHNMPSAFRCSNQSQP